MLVVKTNKNIEKFKSDVAGGFDLKEVISIAIGLFLGFVIILVAVLIFNVPMTVAPYLASIFIAIPILLRFFKPNGMGVKTYKEKQKAFKKGTALAYISTENNVVYGKNPIKEKPTEQQKEDFERFLKNIKRILLLFAGIVVMIVIVMVVMMKWL